MKILNIRKMRANIKHKNGHNTGHKWVPRHDSDGFRHDISRETKMRYLPVPVDLQISWKKTMSTKWTPQKSRKKTMSKKWVHIFLYTFIYFHIPSYTSIYFYIPSYTFKYFHIPSYTPIYFKIFHIRKMRVNMRPNNCHNLGPRTSPRVRFWHKGSGTPNGTQF